MYAAAGKMHHRPRLLRVVRRAAAWRVFLCVLGCLFYSGRAHAYAWMIRHNYTQCAQCHVDPSGGGPMSEYGRAMAELVLRTRYPFDKPDDPGPSYKLKDGDTELARIGGDVRLLSLHSKVEHTKIRHELIWMQADLDASVQRDQFFALGTIGYAPKGALGAAITRGTDSNLVSRQHWLGYWLDKDHSFALRAGRIQIPFGVRSIEHTLWARAYTRSDTNDSQQYGLAAAYLSDSFRAEALGIVGNFQLRPDDFRERGYSAYAEFLPTPKLGIGASSSITHVDLDTRLLKPEWQHAHGLFGRWATPWEPMVLLAEWDYVLSSPRYLPRTEGFVGYVQSDIEPVQGVHFMLTGEASNYGLASTPFSFSGWLSYAWFCAPHADIRLDNVFQSIASRSSTTHDMMLLLQAHLYL